MITLKMIILLTIVIVSSYIGILKSKTFENRVIELRNLQASLSMFKTKIEFTYEPIKEIFEEISNVIYKNEENVFIDTVIEMDNKNVATAWNNAVEKAQKDFTDEDKQIMQTMGKLLGKTDKTGQIREICLTENLLSTQIEKAELEKEKNTKLYKTLGTISGLAISILFI